MDEKRQVENRCIEDRLLLNYLERILDPTQRDEVEEHLLHCSGCRESLALLARLMRPEVTEEEEAHLDHIGVDGLQETANAMVREKLAPSQSLLNPLRGGLHPGWRLTASFLTVVFVAALVWVLFFRQSNVDQGMVALRQAYTQRRPLEARITGEFLYAPYEVGSNESHSDIDQIWLMQARDKLTEAVMNDGTAEAHHSLGRFYLTQHQYDQALRQLEASLWREPKDPSLHSDIGTAYLQKADRDQSLSDLAIALDHFDAALDRKPRLVEALFNRALCYQRMKLFSLAEADWIQFLKQDPTSPWAEEARQNLEWVRQREKGQSQKTGQIHPQPIGVIRGHDLAIVRPHLDQSSAPLRSLFEQRLDESLARSVSGNIAVAKKRWSLDQPDGPILQRVEAGSIAP